MIFETGKLKLHSKKWGKHHLKHGQQIGMSESCLIGLPSWALRQ